ncbi:hypothetical protein [Streptomyces asoensis]|uniref:Uncharacterized protein n=1 Tax=Streptomyces asoensis TaxID=249586 RepID=A0ABQ3RX21_9ACTN|nr:hypothetical protein [Streptomyces asoensis]GGQ51798.1 hypothetical protein GCM10010496_12390 [Streptomyces asoensis]GHI60330.1 hypothetical protein Saso_19800 [Streptomyces asoensis]
MTVCLLWPIGHRNTAGEDGAPLHRDGDTVHLDERDGDDAKLLGVCSTPEKAAERRRLARLLPGFREEPDCFVIDAHTLDEDEWPGGFTRVPDRD